MRDETPKSHQEMPAADNQPQGTASLSDNQCHEGLISEETGRAGKVVEEDQAHFPHGPLGRSEEQVIIEQPRAIRPFKASK